MSGDSANAVLGVVAEKVITPVVNATGRQFGYLFCYNSNIKNLEKKITQLEKSRNDADSFFRAHERNNEERAESSAAWLKDVEQVTRTANEVVASANNVKGQCLNLKGQYVVSRKSTKLADEIRKLQVQAPKILITNPAPSAGMLPGSSSNDGSKGYESRRKAMDEVMAALEDDAVSIIGICGLGGVGKTTMVHEVRERARRQSLFDEVAMASVSQEPNLLKIQKDLGEMLGLFRPKGSENVTAGADELRQRLIKGKKVLVILDDVWDEIKLKEVGIPVGSNCKVVLTSRSKDACTRTGSQRNIEIKELSKEEAWDMFKEAAGECVESENLREIAKEVAAECGGLPIALVTLAKALSNYKEKEAWKDARKQLRESHVTSITGMDEKVYKSIKLSYDFLAREQPQAQPLLLLCCQHPEDTMIKVEKLARYCLALRLFENVQKLNEARDRVHVLVGHLKSCFLLKVCDVTDFEKEWGIDDKKVIVHDVVRDVCLSIVSKVKEEGEKVYMHAMPLEEDGDDECSTGAVSYPKLKLLLEASFGSTLSKESLQQMEELRVFEYAAKYNYNPHPPGALNVLTNLRMLSLDGVLIHEDAMSMIGELRGLEILSFLGSKMDSFPCEIRQLSNLKLLDLRCFEGSGPIPSSILPQLNKLEVLYTGKYYFSEAPKSGEEGVDGESQGRLTELDSLSNLTTLQIRLENPMELLDLQHFCFEKLERFSFRSARSDWFFIQQFDGNLCPSVERILILKRVGMEWVSGTKMESIVRSTVDLHLIEMDWTDLLLIERFVKLERLEMTYWNRLIYIIHDDATGLGEGTSSCNVFMNLETLIILDMKNVRELCHNGNLRAGSLGKLKKLKMSFLPKMRHLWVGPTDGLCLANLREVEIRYCEKLENIFPQSAAKCLVQLHTLEVYSCRKLEGIVCIDDTEVTWFPLLFPKLRCLKISRTSNLRGFYSFDDGREQPLLNPLVVLPSMEKLDVSYLQFRQIVGVGILDTPKFIASELLQNLEEVNVHRCDSLRTVFDFEGQQALGESAHVVTLGKLEKISLLSLPRLMHIFRCHMQDISVPKLQVIHVQECDEFVNIVASNLLKLLQNLKQVKLRGCKSVKAVFNFEGLEVTREDAVGILGELEDLILWNLRNLEHVFMLLPMGTQGFQNLRFLDVRTCGGLGYLLSSSVAHMLVNLESLIVSDCRVMKEVIKMNEDFVEKKIVFRSLRCVKLVRLKNLLSFCSSDLQGFELPSLEQVLIVECPVMKTFCCGPLNTKKLREVNFAHSRFINGKLQGVKRAMPPYAGADDDDDVVDVVDEKPDWKGDLNETVRYFNASQMNRDLKVDDVGDSDDEAVNDIYAPRSFYENLIQIKKEDDVIINTTASSMKAVKPDLDQNMTDSKLDKLNDDRKDVEGTNSSKPMEASLTPLVVSSSPLVADENKELAYLSLNPELRKDAAASCVVSSPSSPSGERSIHLSSTGYSPMPSKSVKVLSDSSSSPDEWKRSRILIQGVYVKAEMKTTFEEILAAYPNFLSGLHLKMARMKTEIVESAIRSLHILRQCTALTISLEQLAYIRDSIDDMEASGLDKAWLERGYQRASLVMKEQKAISASAELARLEREKTEDEAAFEMARAKLVASTARRDAFKAERDVLMQELEAGKELFRGGFDLETSLGNGLLD